MYVLFIIGIAAAVLSGIAAWIVFSIGIRASSGKDLVFGKGKPAGRQEPAAYDWLDQIQEVRVPAAPGIRLCAYAYRGRTGGDWAICIHGYGGRATNMAPYMDHFVRRGFNVLAIDLRGHGRSGGKYYGLGVLDREDIVKWARNLRRESPGGRIVLFGISMGGAAALMAGAAARDGADLVISDSAPSDFTGMFRRVLEGKLGFLTGPVISLVSLYTRLLAGYWLRSASALDSIPDLTVPVLLIHGAADGFVPPSCMDALFAACRAPKERYLCPNADHTGALRTDPDVYWEIVDRFLETYL